MNAFAATCSSSANERDNKPSLHGGGATLLEHLINEQAELTAVERFADWHGSNATTENAYQALMPTSLPAAGWQYAFEVDLDKCSGCKACVVACHTLNGLDEAETWRKVGVLTSTSPRLPVLQHVTTACHHCIDPGCLKGCPVLAYEKDPVTGIVRHLDDQCFGCKYCTMMCPYEVPQYSQSLGIVRKCDMCSQRLSQGEAPACVQACPTQAIKITLVNRDDFQRSSDKAEQRLVPTAPLDALTLPTTQFHSTRLEQSGLSSDQLRSRESMLDTVQPGHAPLVGMLVLTQASVGAWCVLAILHLFGGVRVESMIAPAWISTLVAVVGVHLALLHLGRPWLAFRSFLGWRTSWLSREAILFGVYMAASTGATLAATFEQRLFGIAALISALTGILAVFSSAMIYVATHRKLWSLSRTLGEFAATTIGLGSALAALSLPPKQGWELLIVSPWLCMLAFIPKWFDWHRGSQERVHSHDLSGRSGRLMHDPLARSWRVAWCCQFAALATVALAILCHWHSARPISLLTFAFIWTLCAGCMCAAQMNLRWVAFASVVFPRMPGAGT